MKLEKGSVKSPFGYSFALLPDRYQISGKISLTVTSQGNVAAFGFNGDGQQLFDEGCIPDSLAFGIIG